MAEAIELRFKNRNDKDVVAIVTPPIVLRFVQQNGKHLRVLVPSGSGARAIILTKGSAVPGNPKNPPVPGVKLQTDDAAVAKEDVIQVALDSLDPPPSLVGGGPGVCYDMGRDIFCW